MSGVFALGLSGGSVEAVLLWFYVFIYISLVWLISGLLAINPQLVQRWVGQALLSALAGMRLRGLWVLLLTSLAGLPPAFFFGPKLGLLSLLYEGGFLTLGLGLGLSVMLGWAAYFSLGQRSLGSMVASPMSPLRERMLPTRIVAGASLVFIFLIFGASFLDDIFMVVSWLMA